MLHALEVLMYNIASIQAVCVISAVLYWQVIPALWNDPSAKQWRRQSTSSWELLPAVTSVFGATMFGAGLFSADYVATQGAVYVAAHLLLWQVIRLWLVEAGGDRQDTSNGTAGTELYLVTADVNTAHDAETHR